MYSYTAFGIRNARTLVRVASQVGLLVALPADRIATSAVGDTAPSLADCREVLDGAGEQVLGDRFPRYRGAWLFPYADSDCGPAMQSLVDELTSSWRLLSIADQCSQQREVAAGRQESAVTCIRIPPNPTT